MKPFAIASVSAFALILAACGDDQVAEEERPLLEGDTEVVEPAPQPGEPPGDVADEPARPQLGAPVAPDEEEDAGIAATETPAMQPGEDPEDRLLAEDTRPDVDSTGTLPTELGVQIEPGIYESQLATMRLDAEGDYRIELNEDGRELAGTDTLEGNILAAAPMTETPPTQDANCMFSPEAGGLRVTAVDPSCAFLDGELFERVE